MSWETATAIGLIEWLSLWLALEYFWLSKDIVIIMSIVLVIDFIMWILEVWLKRREELSSKKAVQWLFRKFTRWFLPFIIILVLKWAGLEDVNYLSSAVCWIIIISEGYSILAHIYSINQEWNDKLPEIDALSYLIHWISELLRNAVKEKIPTAEKKEDKVEE